MGAVIELTKEQTLCPLCGVTAAPSGLYEHPDVHCATCGLKVGVQHWITLCAKESMHTAEGRLLARQAADMQGQIDAAMRLVYRQQGYINLMHSRVGAPNVWQEIPPMGEDAGTFAPYDGKMYLLRSPSGYVTTPYRIGVGFFDWAMGSRWNEYDGTAWTDATEDPTHYMYLKDGM